MKHFFINKKAFIRALSALLAVTLSAFAFIKNTPSALAVNGFFSEQTEFIKTPKPFKPVKVEQRELPAQRNDLRASELECMNSAAAAVLIEAKSGQMLLARSEDKRLPMASTTKIMTALVIIENCALDEVVTVTKDALNVGGSCLYVLENEKLTVRDLLYGLMLRSGNDAAVVLAIHAAGSVEAFADMMNERAEKLGLKNTHFVTPNGLHDPEHYTTAFELGIIAAKAMEYPAFREIVQAKYYSVQTDTRSIAIKNKNSMLWDYEDCVGIKTGYTRQAGRCLVFAAERNGMLLIGVVLNCSPMFTVAPKMLDYGFENYSLVRAVSGGIELTRCRIKFGASSVLSLNAGRDVFIPVKNGSQIKLETDITLNDNICAPVFEGDELGKCELKINGCVVGETPLVAGSTVQSRGFADYISYIMHLFARG